MNLLMSALNTGDMFAQLIMFVFALGIPLILILIFLSMKKKDDRLKRLEDKVDQLIADKHN
ncbi:hypothetical protein E3U55_06190 [Filobacillus milosensis]|uniref:DUF4083 domain-containing protein n=1 Tax=Filobacillus milosensis TaxID=94137 RepID=A0A4Y8IQT3_9BACI|nr:hypothetical protein [Filobacillus milosensis]TFB22824.1 hypothetical protein E3U55_06190 [Filobacillus milosensis]